MVKLNWSSKEEADAEWEAWSQNEDGQAWAEEYSNVMVCDGPGGNSFDADYPIAPMAHAGALMKVVIFIVNITDVIISTAGRNDMKNFYLGL